ncbi:MAG TPA: lipocalin family protein [Gemmatimonadales bacterium]|jgi:hypothetical protein|nr:lipocalin family protein [Gemmatimonadales bacterium]
MRQKFMHAGIAALALVCGGCGDEAGPTTVTGSYTMVSENGQPLPSDPSAPFGCCLTLSGSITFTATAYDLRTSHKNKNNGLEFDNAEQGTYTRDGSTLRFTRTGGSSDGFPYLLAPGKLSDGGRTLTLLYGDEGPGSDQTEAVFAKDD